MSQTWRFPIILFLSILLGMPALREMTMFSGDLFATGATYLAALALSWFGVTSIFSLLDHYATSNQADLDRIALEEMALEMAEEEALLAADGPVAADQRPAATVGASRGARAGTPGPAIDNLAGQGGAPVGV